MKQKRLKRKTVSLLLTAAMILTSFPVSGKEARAAGTSDHSLSVTAFAEKDQLMSAFTPDVNGSSSNIGKLAFGKNSTSAVQEWYILGKDEGVTGDNTVLFAAGPIATKQPFNAETVERDYNKNYDDEAEDWGCAYEGNAPDKVNANHYGGSDIRAALNTIAGNEDYFTTAEQGLMNGTTVTTHDTKAGEDYTTTDKLYALTADGHGARYTTIKAGTNAQIALERSTYWSSGSYFWLRAPGTDYSNSAWVAYPPRSVDVGLVLYEFALLPAFNLNLSSVIFASAAKVASSGNAESGTIADGTAMTLRLDGSDKTIGTVVYDETAGKIVAQRNAEASGNVSLVVQGNDGTKDWYYSVQAGEATVVTKEQIQTACGISGDISLADCKIWLETTIDNVAYAKMAEAKNLNEEVTLELGKTVLRADEIISNGTDGMVTIDKGCDGTVDTTIKLPSAGNIHITEAGNITVPAGGKVQSGDGKELILPDGGSVDTDGNAEADKIISGDTTVTAPEGGKVTADKDGNITVPAGGKVQTEGGKELTLPDGGTVDKDGNVSDNQVQPPVNPPTGTPTNPPIGTPTNPPTGTPTNPPAGTPTNSPTGTPTNPPTGTPTNLPTGTPTNPPAGTPTNSPTGTPTNPPTVDPPATVPAGGKVETESGKELTLPNGGTVDEDGNVETDKIISGETTVTAPAGGNLTADKDGNITVPAGGKVENGGGKELILPNGGKVDKNETVEADKIISDDTTVTAPEGGKVTADKVGNITVPAGGTVQTGDEELVILPNGGTVNKDGNVSVNQTTPPTPTIPSTTEPTEKPMEETPIPHPDATVPPEEVVKNSEKLDSGVTAKWKGNTFTLGWQAVQGVDGYDIFAAQSGKKLNKKSLAKTAKGKKTSVSLTKIGGKKLSGKKNYKFKIKAWKQIDGKKVYIGTSKTYHVAGGKNKKYTNARKLSPSKKKYTLKKGKSVSLKVRIVKQSKKKKLLPKSHGPELWYFSDNKEVATVTSKGKVKAKGEGTCYIYVTALNGISVKIKITVK